MKIPLFRRLSSKEAGQGAPIGPAVAEIGLQGEEVQVKAQNHQGEGRKKSPPSPAELCNRQRQQRRHSESRGKVMEYRIKHVMMLFQNLHCAQPDKDPDEEKTAPPAHQCDDRTGQHQSREHTPCPAERVPVGR